MNILDETTNILALMIKADVYTEYQKLTRNILQQVGLLPGSSWVLIVTLKAKINLFNPNPW